MAWAAVSSPALLTSLPPTIAAASTHRLPSMSNSNAQFLSSSASNNLTLPNKQFVRLSMRSDLSALSTDTSTSLNTEYRGPVIPPYEDKSYRHRTLVLCFDGTGNQFDLDNSNVIQFFSVLKKGDRKRQLVYYQSGIGTYTIPEVASTLYSRTSKLLDLMFAKSLNHHVMSGYQFLMQNYKEGDKICIFGFSRGAYTARALAGMIHKVGLLPAGNEQQVPFAYKMYQNDKELGWKQSVAFKKAFSINVDIAFVGVWDTVASVGLLPKMLPFTKSNTAIKVFRHAVSLDEHRVKFKPSTYERITAEEARRGDFTPPAGQQSTRIVTRGRRLSERVKESREVKEVKEEKEVKSKTDEGGMVSAGVKTAVTKVPRDASGSDPRRSGSGSRSRAIFGSIKRSARGVKDSLHDVVERVSLDRNMSRNKDKDKDDDDDDDDEDLSPDTERNQLEQMYLDRSRPTDVLEVWFAGCHCDVGGGSVPNNTPNNLARIPLRWMIRECFLAHTGIQFEVDCLRDLGLDPATLYPRVLKRPQALSYPADEAAPPSPPPKDVTSAKRDAENPKQEALRAEDTTGKMKNGERALIMEEAVEVKTGKTDVADKEARSRNAPPLHGRQNNFSLDGTLVDYDAREEALDIQVECCSVMDEKISSSICEDHSALHGTPTLGATLSPVPVPAATTTAAASGATFMAAEAQADIRDAHEPMYDQLKLAKCWWLLEFLPMRERVQRSDGTWKKKWSINRGRPRVVPQDEPLNVHWSVKMRMDSRELRYMPRVRFTKEPVWVD